LFTRLTLCQPDIVPNTMQMNLSMNRDVDATLKHFQEWQYAMNPGDDSHPNHHDCAILISKYATQAILSKLNLIPRLRVFTLLTITYQIRYLCLEKPLWLHRYIHNRWYVRSFERCSHCERRWSANRLSYSSSDRPHVSP